MTSKPSYEELERRIQKLEKAESERNLTEDHLRIIFDNTQDAIFIHDLEGKILDVNDKMCRIYGLTKEEALKVSIEDVSSSRMSMKILLDRWQKAVNGEKLLFEWEARRPKDESVFNVEVSVQRVSLHDKDIIIANVRDITERKRHEDELRMAKELTARIIEDGPVAITLVDCDGKIVFANRHAERLFGLEKPNIKALGYNSSEWLIVDVDGSHFPDERLPFRQVMSTGQAVYNVQHAITRPDAARKILSINGAPLHDEQGRIERVVFVILDITERKLAEEALRESEEKFRALFEKGPIGVAFHKMVYDDSGKAIDYRFLDANSSFLELTGVDPRGKCVTEAFPGIENDPFDWIGTFGRVAKTAEQIRFEQYLQTNKRWYDCVGYQVKPEYFVAAFVDITERKQAEAEQKKLQVQLNQAQKMESVGRLAGGVAHDFNNMLGVILGHTEMALEEMDPAAPLYDSLQAVQHAAERSAALTRQLLAFARKQTVAPRVIDINDTVAGMLKMLRRLIGEDINLLWQPGKDLQPVKVDPSQIDQLLANLCVNARDAIEGVGKVTIETGAKTFDEEYCTDHLGFLPGEYVLLEVSDDGCGMDQKTLSHIFEPFFTTKEQSKGTGLGLASVFGMVKQNNGFINVYSEPGRGTTFKIYLPVYTVKSDAVVEKAHDLPAEHGNETILLVEDESAILKMTTTMLERLGYTVVAAATPGEAVRLAHEYQGRIDLLMTDVVMPEMNGRELAGNLLSHYPALKRLFMSGYTANVIAHHGVLDEGVHFIQKPFSKKDLGGKLREALEG